MYDSYLLQCCLPLWHTCVILNNNTHVRHNAKKVNEVFVIGSQSFAMGASLQSYNKFVGLCSGVNFIIPHEPLVLCRDSIFVKRTANECLMNVKLLYIMSNLQKLQSTN